jgi:hypothetical protein
MTPLTPLQQHPCAGPQGVGIATLIFRYFLRYFSSTHRTDLSRFRGTFHSFDPVGLCYFRYSCRRRQLLSYFHDISSDIARRLELSLLLKQRTEHSRVRRTSLPITDLPKSERAARFPRTVAESQRIDRP